MSIQGVRQDSKLTMANWGSTDAGTWRRSASILSRSDVGKECEHGCDGESVNSAVVSA